MAEMTLNTTELSEVEVALAVAQRTPLRRSEPQRRASAHRNDSLGDPWASVGGGAPPSLFPEPVVRLPRVESACPASVVRVTDPSRGQDGSRHSVFGIALTSESLPILNLLPHSPLNPWPVTSSPGSPPWSSHSSPV